MSRIEFKNKPTMKDARIIECRRLFTSTKAHIYLALCGLILAGGTRGWLMGEERIAEALLLIGGLGVGVFLLLLAHLVVDEAKKSFGEEEAGAHLTLYVDERGLGMVEREDALIEWKTYYRISETRRCFLLYRPGVMSVIYKEGLADKTVVEISELLKGVPVAEKTGLLKALSTGQ